MYLFHPHTEGLWHSWKDLNLVESVIDYLDRQLKVNNLGNQYFD